MPAPDHGVASPSGLGPQAFQEIAKWMRTHHGVVLAERKRIMVETRLRRRLHALELETFDEYVDYALKDASNTIEQARLVDALTTHKTDFFREPHHFEFLKTGIVTPFLRTRSPGTLRVWSAGCSTGEEPYSIAMALQCMMPGRYEILATDVSVEVLRIAQAGHYPRKQLEQIPPTLRSRFFRSESSGESRQMVVSDRVHRHVRFAQQNLMASSYTVGPRMHLVFCRNVLIYFDRPTQRSVISKLLDAMVPHGFLFLGHSENVHGLDLPLVPVGKSVFRKNLAPLRSRT